MHEIFARIGEADNRTAFEELVGRWAGRGEHVRENRGLSRQQSAVHAESDVFIGDEDNVPVVEPKFFVAPGWLRGELCLKA